jgi:hypothetical protein
MSDSNYRGNGIAMRIPAGKGTIHRPTNYKNYDDNFERIFGKKSRKQRIKEIDEELSNEEYEAQLQESCTQMNENECLFNKG